MNRLRSLHAACAALALSVGCIPEAEPVCRAGQPYCVVKADRTCEPGSHPELLFQGYDETIGIQVDDDTGQVWTCCPDGEPVESCARRTPDSDRTLTILEGDTRIALSTSDLLSLDASDYGDRLWELRLTAGARLYVHEYHGSFATLGAGDVAALPPLPEARAFATVFELDTRVPSSLNDALLSLPRPAPAAGSGNVLVYAMAVHGACSGAPAWPNGPSESSCYFEYWNDTSYGSPAELCSEFITSVGTSSSLCAEPTKVQIGQRILLCRAAPCSWVQLATSDYAVAADGQVHITLPRPGLYAVIAE